MTNKYTWIKRGLVCGLFLFVFLNATLHGTGKVSNAKLEDVANAALETSDLAGEAAAENRTLKRLYGLTAEEYKGVALYVAPSSMEARELLLVQLKSTSQQESVQEAIEKRRETQKQTFQDYEPEQYALLEESVLEVKSGYVLYVVGEKSEAVRAAFEESL